MSKTETSVIIFLLGLTSGSFINAYEWRVYKQSQQKLKKAQPKRYSILTGRSMCPQCGHRLRAVDLVPVFSWLALGGKCRYCHKPISVSYPTVELLTGLIFLGSYIYWPFGFSGIGLINFIFWLVILVNLIALALYDIKRLILPDRMVYPLFVLAVCQIIVNLFFVENLHYLLSCLYGFVIGGGVFYLLFQVSKGKWIGGGDVKLGALLGLVLGSGTYAFFMIFLSSLIGTLCSIPLLISGKVDRKTLIPYGPYLILATVIIKLFGQSFTSWLGVKGLTF